MTRFFRMSVVLLAVIISGGLSGAAGAAENGRVLTWANDGDLITTDPHARNESFVFSILGNVYEGLVRRGRNYELAPSLAADWAMVDANTWRFNLRRGVRFHDGSPFTADDVVFSFERAKSRGSDVAPYLATVKEVRRIDEFTVDLVTSGPDPILPLELTAWYMMSRSWSERFGATRPTDLSQQVTSHADRHANGTGSFRLTERQPAVRTVLMRNPDWWGSFEGNVDTAVFVPVGNAATRISAFVSGQFDVIQAVPVQDAVWLAGVPGVELLKKPELRVIFIGLDQARNELLDSSVKGKNPLKDLRVRQAIYSAIDVEALTARVMRGFARPTGILIPQQTNGYDPALDTRLPADLGRATALLKEAGYPEGFEVGMDCPNDRYVNDEAICQAVTSMLARIGVRIRLNVQPRAKFFAKVNAPRFETSLVLMGWSPASGDAHNVIVNVMAGRDLPRGRGQFNHSGYANPDVDALTDAILSETDPKKRSRLIGEAVSIHKREIGHIPLHQQMILWAARSGIDLVMQPNSHFPLHFVKLP